jgi:mannan polymerase II complex ANP1 subunit
MAGGGHLTQAAPFSVRAAHNTRTGLRPFLRIFSKSAINKASVPAKAIARIAFQDDSAEAWGRERYYILDSAYEAGSIIPVLRRPPETDGLLQKMMQQIEVGVKGMGSPASKVSRRTGD